jgi:hypothetical protein
MVSFHALRHTHASALIASRVDVVAISRRLGHANPNVTLSVYAHLFNEDDSGAALAIEAAMRTGKEQNPVIAARWGQSGANSGFSGAKRYGKSLK